MTPTAHPLISLKMVSKTFGDDPLDYRKLVLKNIYLDIMDGEFVIIYGPSGSGKSTILNLVAGLELPTAGQIKVRRHNLATLSPDELALYHRRRMGYVFQSFNLIKSLNVWENVALPQTANGRRYRQRRRRAMEILKLLNINHYADRHPNELSGGEQQRVAIARALVNNPEFLLVDEPTGNLDSQSAQEVMAILRSLHRDEHHTIILVTHNADYLVFATRVIYLEDGKIVIEEKRNEEAAATTQSLAEELGQRGTDFYSLTNKGIEAVLKKPASKISTDNLESRDSSATTPDSVAGRSPTTALPSSKPRRVPKSPRPPRDDPAPPKSHALD